MTTHKTGTREQWLAARLELLKAEKELTIEVAHPNVVPHVEWLAARNEFLTKEKEFTRLRDELIRQRRALPWEKVEKRYEFDSTRGKITLAELFDGRSQLIVYHFMFGPGWQEGCRSCSYVADHFDGSILHLANRDTTLAVVSRAPLAEIEAFKKRMGWKFQWVSSYASDFNSTITFPSRQRRCPAVRSTTTRLWTILAKKAQDSAFSPRIRRAKSFTPIPLMGEGWIF
jgi:predicted dithiol-disulfide oxidoreductase (DUF899 family)